MFKNIFIYFFFIVLLSIEANAATNSQAYNAVTAAQKCYRSLPSHFQKGGTLDAMYKATRAYKDASKYEKMGRSGIANSYYNNAVAYADVVRRTGRAVGSKVC